MCIFTGRNHVWYHDYCQQGDRTIFEHQPRGPYTETRRHIYFTTWQEDENLQGN